MKLSSRFFSAASVLRAPDAGPDAGGKITISLADLPSLKNSPGFAARREAEAKAEAAKTKAAEADKAKAVSAPGEAEGTRADAAPGGDGDEDGAGDDDEPNPGEQITGEADAADGAPVTETAEAKAARLEAELAALKSGTETPEAKAARLERELAELKAKQPSAETEIVPAELSNARFKSLAEVDAREATLYQIVDFAEDNPDGFEGKDAEGRPVTYTAEQLASESKLARRELRTLGGEREKLRAVLASQSAARAKYPTHFDASHADAKAVAGIFKEFPGIAGNHAAAAAILAGRRGASATAAPVRKTPPVVPGSAARSEGRPTAGASRKTGAVQVDRDKLRKTGRGIAAALFPTLSFGKR